MIFWLTVLTLAPAWACEVMPLAAPAMAETLAHSQPTFRWSGDGTAAYRVQVAVVLPEARVLATYDTEVMGNSYQLPVAIPVERAALKVRVTQGCAPQAAQDMQDLHAQGPSFFVDLRGTCMLEAAGIAQKNGVLSWPPVPGAQRYRVRLLQQRSVHEGLVPLAEQEVVQSAWPLPSAGPQGLGSAQVAAVQPVCGGYPGRAVAWVVKGGVPPGQR